MRSRRPSAKNSTKKNQQNQLKRGEITGKSMDRSKTSEGCEGDIRYGTDREEERFQFPQKLRGDGRGKRNGSQS
jgi:hypothetical protein